MTTDTVSVSRAAIEKIDAYFKSGNSIPVERATITAELWGPIRAALQQPAAPDSVDYSIKKGDEVQHGTTWTLTRLTVEDVNWALKAAALRLGDNGGIVVWSVAGLKKVKGADAGETQP